MPPADPGRYPPTAERPVRAKARLLAPDTEIQPHSDAWAQVAISFSGVARITAGDATCLVPAWRTVWTPPLVEHVVTVVEAAELRTVYIRQGARSVGPGVPHMPHMPRVAQGAWRQCRVLELSTLLRERVLQMDTRMDRAADSVPPPSQDEIARERRLGEHALDAPRRAAAPGHRAAAGQAPARAVRGSAGRAPAPRHVRRLDGWAADAGASPRTVARLFRQQLGTSFGPWRPQVLLARALTLAAQGRPMGLIAAELGYASARAFTAMVRRSVGVPPGRFFGHTPGRTPARTGKASAVVIAADSTTAHPCPPG